MVNYWRVAPIVRAGSHAVGLAIGAAEVALFVAALVWALATPMRRRRRR